MNVGVYGGYINYDFVIRKGMYAHYAPKFKKSNSFVYGLLFNLKPPFWNNKVSFSFATEFSITSYKEDTNDYFYYPSKPGFNRNMKIATRQNALLLKYNFYHNKKFSPFLQFGPKIGYQTGIQHDLYPDIQVGEEILDYDETIKPPISTIIIGGEGGIGFDYNFISKYKVFLYASYSYQAGVYNELGSLSIKTGLTF